MGEERTTTSGDLSRGVTLIDSALVEVLGCPLEESRPKLRLEGAQLICDSCHMAFPIVDGIPHLLPESAIPIQEK